MEQDRAPQIWTPLQLTDGQEIEVDARTYPMLMEWEWEYKPELRQAVRTDNSAVRLYDEQIRLLAKSEVDRFPVLDRPAIRSLFGGLPEFAEMVKLSQRQREIALFEMNAYLPAASAFLAGSLSRVLARYYRWFHEPERLVFVPDPENLTPGSFNTVTAKPSYRTLGQWMREVTGRWLPEKESPTGLLPEPMYVEVMKLVTREWRYAVKICNGSSPKWKDVESCLRWEDAPVWLLVQHAIELIEYYPL